MTIKVLLFGPNGQVGSACRQAFGFVDCELISLDRSLVDFSEPEQVYQAIIDAKPDWVVNACAYTAVDKAESEPELAFRVNSESVARMAQACAELAIPTLHISTDYVFNGLSKTPYKVESATDPIGVYGGSKLAGEEQLRALNPKHIILRTSWVFGEQGGNFVKTMLRLGKDRDELGVVSDQRGCPTYAGDLADVIVQCVVNVEQHQDQAWGTYHCSNRGECSWYEFSQAIFDQGVKSGVLSVAPRIKPLTTAEYPTIAQRPAYSVLDCSKLEGLLARPIPHWQKGLESVCKALAAGLST